MADPLPPTLDNAVESLARLFARHRCGGSVYMDGSHNPRPSEYLEARRFIADFLAELRRAVVTDG